MTTTILAYIPSPDQGVWHLGPVPLRAYALCIIAGIVAALIIGDRRWEARGGERGVIYDVALWAVPFGLIGGRLYHVLTDWETYFGPDGAGFLAALKIWEGGLGIWGAVALGGVGAWIACKRRGIPLPAFGDAIAPGIVLAQAIGRLGNYFNQELYGRATTLPWGLEIFQRRNENGVLDSLNGVSTGQPLIPGVEAVHPTFLYELLWNLLVFAVLIIVDRRFTIGHGRLFALYIAGYCVGRFWVELMRDDFATQIAGIRINSFTATFVFIGAVIYIMAAPKGREDPATLRGNAADDGHEEDRSKLDGLADELSAVPATTGVVAAAKVAGDEDKSPVAAGTVESEAAAEAEELTEDVAVAPSEDIAKAEEFAAAGAAAEAEGGLGSVEGDDAAEADAVVVEVHEAAVEDAAAAEALADDVAAEAEAQPDAPESKVSEPEIAASESADDGDVVPEAGLGSVDGDEVVAAEDDAAEVHAAAVDGVESAEAAADSVDAEVVPEVEVVEAAPAPEGTEVAEALAADVEPAPTDVADDESSEVVEVHEDDAPEAALAAPEGTEVAEALAADAEPEAGLGSVDGDEVVAAEDSAAEVHEAAVEKAESAEDLADEVAVEPDAPEAVTPERVTPDVETPEPEAGLGSVDGDEVVAAEDSAAEVHEAAVENVESAKDLADDVAAEPAKPAETVAAPAPEQPRRRWWNRRG